MRHLTALLITDMKSVKYCAFRVRKFPQFHSCHRGIPISPQVRSSSNHSLIWRCQRETKSLREQRQNGARAFVRHRQQKSSCENLGRPQPSAVPLTNNLYKTLRGDLQSLATTLPLSFDLKCGQTAITTFFLTKGGARPHASFLNKKRTSVTLKRHYDSPTLTTKSWDFKSR